MLHYILRIIVLVCFLDIFDYRFQFIECEQAAETA